MESNINSKMPSFCASLYQTMQEALSDIRIGIHSQLRASQQAVTVLTSVIAQLRELTISHAFATEEEEIYFFKEIKPMFYSRFVYHQSVFLIELRRPLGGQTAFQKYIAAEFRKLEEFYAGHRDYYEYYRSGATYRDKEYFLRNRVPLPATFDPSYFNADARWCTAGDYTHSCVLANEDIRRYLQTISDGSSPEPVLETPDRTSATLTWTASKAAFIELLYALQSSGVFNNGASDIKQLATWFEQHFNVSLGNYYNVFQEIRIRKKNRTSFLDQLKERLSKRMDDADDRIS